MEAAKQRRRRLELVVRMALAIRGGTRRDLAHCLGRDPSNLIGSSGLPKIDVAMKLARALDWPIESLLLLLLQNDLEPQEPEEPAPNPQAPGLRSLEATGLALAGRRERLDLSGIGDPPTGPRRRALGDQSRERSTHQEAERSASFGKALRASDGGLRLIERIAALQRHGWHERAAHLAHSALLGVRPSGQRCAVLADQVDAIALDRPFGQSAGQAGGLLEVLAASKLWSGWPVEALSLITLELPCSSADESSGPPRRDRGAPAGAVRAAASAEATSPEAARTLGATVIGAMALAELAQQRLIEPFAARRALALALERCTPEALAASSNSLAAAGLMTQRVLPMLTGTAAGMTLVEGGGSIEQSLDRCREELGEAREQARVKAAHEAVVVLRLALDARPGECGLGSARPESGWDGLSEEWAPEGSVPEDRAALRELAGSDRAGVRRGADWEGRLTSGTAGAGRTLLLLTQAAMVLEALRRALDALEDWPLRRKWFELESRRTALMGRATASGRRRGAGEWALHKADLVLLGGLVARYPQIAPRILSIMASAPLIAREAPLGAMPQPPLASSPPRRRA